MTNLTAKSRILVVADREYESEEGTMLFLQQFFRVILTFSVILVPLQSAGGYLVKPGLSMQGSKFYTVPSLRSYRSGVKAMMHLMKQRSDTKLNACRCLSTTVIWG